MVLEWEEIDDTGISKINRAKVPGGWLVQSVVDALTSMHEDMSPTDGYQWRESLCFVPDANHNWGIK